MSHTRPRVPGSPSRRPPTIVDWFERTKTAGEPLILTEPSKVWVDRLWHMVIRTAPRISEIGEEAMDAEYDEMYERFWAYLEGLDDDRERGLTAAVYGVLLETIAERGDELPRCKGCGAFLCPHCGHRYATHGGPPAA